MIKSLKIKHFQSHKDTVVEFSPNVTCFTGLNNHGKSVIIRALLKIIRDEPDGISFITDTPKKESECEITLETDKGKVIRLIKRGGTGNNMYIVNDLEFSNFSKTGIPLEVKEILDISDPVNFGDSTVDLNFQTQFDLMFLTQGSGLASLRGKVLGKVTNIDEVQRAIQIGASTEKQLKQETNKLEKEIEENKKNLEQYNDLQYQEEVLNSIKGLLQKSNDQFQKIENIKKKKQEIRETVQNARKQQSRLEIISQGDNVYQNFDIINTLLTKIKLLKEIFQLKNSIDYYSKLLNLPSVSFDHNKANTLYKQLFVSKELSSLQIYLKPIQNIINVKIDINTHVVESLYYKYNNLTILKEFFDNSSKNYQQLTSLIEISKEEQKVVENEFEQLKKDLKICPTCLKPF